MHLWHRLALKRKFARLMASRLSESCFAKIFLAWKKYGENQKVLHSQKAVSDNHYKNYKLAQARSYVLSFAYDQAVYYFNCTFMITCFRSSYAISLQFCIVLFDLSNLIGMVALFQVLELWHHEAQNKAYEKATLKRCAARMQNRLVAAALGTWQTRVRDKVKRRQLLISCVSSLQHRTMANAFRSWYFWSTLRHHSKRISMVGSEFIKSLEDFLHGQCVGLKFSSTAHWESNEIVRHSIGMIPSLYHLLLINQLHTGQAN